MTARTAWHGAKFSACNGDIEDAPALDSLYSFPVSIENDKVFIDVDLAKAKDNNRKPKATSNRSSKGDKVDILIVGGGAGGNQAAQGLRELDFNGSITIVSSEPYLPIDRTKLSKALIDDPSKIAMRDESFYTERGIDFKKGKAVTSIDFGKSIATLDDGSSISYGKIILSTGGSPNMPPVDGKDLDNIFLLRTLEHTKKINAALSAKTKGETKPKLVIIGSSFIGLEVAVAAQGKADITVVGTDPAPFTPQLGQEVGNGLRKFHESKGVKFYLEQGLKAFEPSCAYLSVATRIATERDTASNPKEVGYVITDNGSRIEADLVVLGLGVKPRTDYLENNAEIELEKGGSINVDKYFKIESVKAGNAYAIGDIAKWIDANTGQRASIQHWNIASNGGRAVANNIAGTPKVRWIRSF